MFYIHDVWVNWFYGDDRGYKVLEFFEWSKEDDIKLLDKVPVLIVTKEFYNHVARGYPIIPDELLEWVDGEAYERRDNYRKKIYNAFVLTDKQEVIAVFTDGTNEPVMKSKLIPRQERIVLDEAEFKPTHNFEIIGSAAVDVTTNGDKILDKIANIKPEYMIGLTRNEKEMKEVLFDCLFTLSCSDNIEEVRYWYIELFPKKYREPSTSKMSITEMLEEMFDFLKVGWSKEHTEFGNRLVLHYGINSELWKNLHKKSCGHSIT